MKQSKVVLCSVFKTKEQEEAFFKASRKYLGLGTKLEWEEERFTECSRKNKKKKLNLKK